jgi:hypothetical protein
MARWWMMIIGQTERRDPDGNRTLGTRHAELVELPFR